jgi:hypothetical protein
MKCGICLVLLLFSACDSTVDSSAKEGVHQGNTGLLNLMAPIDPLPPGSFHSETETETEIEFESVLQPTPEAERQAPNMGKPTELNLN